MAVGLGLLDTIGSPDDLKRLSSDQLAALCGEIRDALLRYGHLHGGHIGSNLGVVELTVALHAVFDSPRDRIVFDVSHQSYVHKMLTGRAAAFTDPARFGEVTGFTNPDESAHDQFVLGHTGTSISLACGLAKARDMANGTSVAGGASGIGNVVAVIGDGSLSSGVAFEGLNNAAEQGGNLIVVVNDNEMSIAGDFGGMYATLARLRASDGTAQPNLFEAFGFDYRYVGRGNDVNALVEALRAVKDIDHPVVVHVHTMKGLGFPEPAQGGDAHDHDAHDHTAHNIDHAEPWRSDHCTLTDAAPHAGQCEASHWQTPDAALGRPDDPRKYYGKLAMASLEPRFAAEPGLTVVVPATPGSNGITHDFRERAGAHYVDTGITESHAVAYAAGIARAGGMPVVATTASFFQRAYDQFFQEMSLNRTRVTILDFLGGLSGSDNTHSGAYDVPMFANIPGVTMLCPTSGAAMLDDLAWATMPAGAPGCPDGPVVIRMPGERILEAERAAGSAGDGPDLEAGAAYGRRVAAMHAAGTAGATSSESKESGASEDSEASASGTSGTSGVQTVPLPTTAPLTWSVVRLADADRDGDNVAILALGNTLPLGRRVVDRLDATLVDPRQCSSLDVAALESLRATHRIVVTLEDGQLEGGWGEKVTAYYANHRDGDERDGADAGRTDDAGHAGRIGRAPIVLNVGAAKEFTDRIPLAALEERYGLTCDAIVARVEEARRALAQDPRDRA